MPATASSGDRSNRTTIVTFSLDGDRYCVESRRLSSVLGVGDASVIDDADDPWHAGEITVGGETIRVIDLFQVFSPPVASLERPPEPKLLVFGVTDDDGAYIGWLVDDVGVTQRVDRRQLEATPQGMSFVTGRLPVAGNTYLWLDEEAIHAE
ncbi:chemotaxis protein CheW [Natronosalvus vescus]|uniref:chemotaxis protein CheW n=1 Tax=Natronosalvus vescus TaxID=2953881 RepID=UPI002090D5D7|nr:chemotaxis protein CheW [Natronosalvus vescus]